MTATTRLYYDDPLALDFDATVVAHRPWQGRDAVVLDRSAFYPEAGGQLGDQGALGDGRVEDVQVADDGAVLHVLAEGTPLPAVGARVHGAVERARRRLHMALHTGQHMLSAALLDVAGAETVSARLGATACTLDVHLPQLDEGALRAALDRVRDAIEDDRPVRAWFPTPDELAALPLRRAPKVSDNVRVVAVEGFDVSPCGGTHCTRSAQVGHVTVTGVERYKGKTRITFLAGRAALHELEARSRALAELGRVFTCGPLDVGRAVDRLRTELTAGRSALAVVRDRWAESLAERLVRDADAAGTTRIPLLLPDDPVETLRALGARITARSGTVALLASQNADGLQVLVARGEGSTFDCGAWLKQAAARAGGRAGGSPGRAEGRLPLGADWHRLVEET